MSEVTVTSLFNLRNEVRYGDGQTLVVDEPAALGGEGAGPDPYTLLLAALGGCVSMTVTLYARRKGWPLERVTVRLRQRRVHAADCAACGESASEGFIHHIERAVELEGDLTQEQRARLKEIAHRCPVHRTLTSEIAVTELSDDAP
jgi:putative redox protein